MKDLPTLKKDETPPPSFVGYSHDGHFVHYCHCGEWGAFSVGYDSKNGKFGTWFCKEHRPR